MIRVYPSRLEGEPLETHETTERMSVVEWLRSVAPEFSMDATDRHPTITLNGEPLPVDEWPLTFFGPEDVLDVYIEAKAIGTVAAWAAVIMAAIAIVMVLTMKKPGEQKSGRPNTIEDPGALANMVRWGDPIPEIAGAPRTYPDYILPPRRFYQNRTQQWVDSMVCIGVGTFQTDPTQVFIGDTPAPNLGDDIELRFFGPGETIPPPYRDWWHSPEEVGFTSLAGAGLTMGAVSTGGSPTPLAWTPNISFAGSTITGDVPVPTQWEVGTPVRVEAAHPVTFDGNTVQSDLLDTLQLGIGDVIELLGERDGDYTVTSIIPGSAGGPGSAASATGSAPPARFDFGTTHAGLAIGFAGTTYTVALAANLAGMAELVAAFNSQLNASPLRARDASGALELYQRTPYTGGGITLAGDVTDLLGSPTYVNGVAASSPVGTRYVVGGANFGTGTEVTAAGRDGLLYTITGVAGSTITVAPPGVAFWSGFPASVTASQSSVSVDRGSLPGGWLGPFVAVPERELADALEVDILFPGGLVYNRRSGGVRVMTVAGRVQWRELGATVWNTQAFSFSGSSPDQIGFTIRVDLPTPARVEVRVGRNNAPSSNPMHVDGCQWTGLRARIVGAPTSYPGLTLAHVRLRSGDKVSGAVENRMSVRAVRMLPTFDDPKVLAPTRDIAPFFLHMMSTVGYGRELIDMEHIEALHQIWSSRGDTFDLSVNSSSTLKTVANYCLQAGFAELTLMRGKISAARDAYRVGSPTRVYSPQEMVTPLVESTEAIMPDDIDGVDIEYVDYYTGRTLTESYRLIGDLGNRVEKIKAPGVTGRTQAWRIAARRRRMAAYRRTAYKGTTELAAMNSFYMDHVGLQDGIPEWGQSAFVISRDGLRLTLSEPVQPVGGEAVAMIRRADGTASPPVPVTVSGRTVTLAAMPPDVTVTNDPNHPTVVYLGSRTQVVHEALMTEIRPSGEARVEFQAVNMDNRVYLEDDMGPDRTILTSEPYPYFFRDNVDASAGIARAYRGWQPRDEANASARIARIGRGWEPHNNADATATITGIERVGRPVQFDNADATATITGIRPVLPPKSIDNADATATITGIRPVLPPKSIDNADATATITGIRREED